ncbi:hypothetical protein AAFC00_000817 [Neodothiora populina]|uniref:Carbohydrate-binding-like protein n=1 Tax=Neodothiora populina TaxID=2781224 RepID=A0ABR3PLU7_9PEZI
MRSSIIIPAAFAAMAVANPTPQEIDWDLVDSLDPVPTATIPVVDAAAQVTTIAYEASAAASTVAAAIIASGLAGADDASSSLSKRDIAADTPEAFLANTDFSDAATNAQTPNGYVSTFNNLQASNNAYGYLGYSILQSYDTIECSKRCDAIDGCASFNIYYERDPVTQPTKANPNPASTTLTKCVYWGGPIDPSNAVNNGQYQQDFHVVIAGSNGYMNKTVAPVDGYAQPTYLGAGAIEAPLDCNKHDTYMGVKIFTKGPFDASQCAAACTATSVYDLSVGIPQTCQFFNTYLLLKNGSPVGQYCAMYNQTWPASYATNKGQWRGTNHYTIGHSYSYSNATNPALFQGCQK